MMTRDEINAHYALLAAEYGTTHSFVFGVGGRFSLKQSQDFLLEMMPRFERRTEDSSDLLLSIVQGSKEEDIRWILNLQGIIEGTTYRDIRGFLESFNLYIGKGLIRKPNRVKSDVQKLVALYDVTIALLHVQPDYHRGNEMYPLVSHGSREGEIYYINNKELVTLVTAHHERSGDIEDVIRQQGYVHMPSIQHVLNGSTKGVSSGAL